jgi:hypothetical protein
MQGTLKCKGISFWPFEEVRLQNNFLQILILHKLIILTAKAVKSTRGCSKHGLAYKETLTMPLKD